jgi:hypothetical protein
MIALDKSKPPRLCLSVPLLASMKGINAASGLWSVTPSWLLVYRRIFSHERIQKDIVAAPDHDIYSVERQSHFPNG